MEEGRRQTVRHGCTVNLLILLADVKTKGRLKFSDGLCRF